MNFWGDRAGVYSRRSFEGEPVEESPSKSIRGAPEPCHPSSIIVVVLLNILSF
jgi:hypothetical protein